MADQAHSRAVLDGAGTPELTISIADRAVLRPLAARVAELAARPIEQTKRDLWRGLNSLRPGRPLVLCWPENSWNEVFPPGRLQCSGELARQWEMTLRMEVYWGEELRDDRVIEPYFTVSHIYTDTGWGVYETRIGGEDGGAFIWDPPLKSYDSMRSMVFPQLIVDHYATERLVDLARETLGDLLPVRLKTVGWAWPALSRLVASLRGLQQLMYDMIDQPADLHRLMAFVRDGSLAKLDFLEQNGLLSLNNDGAYVGSGGFGWTDELPQPGFTGKVRTRDLWGFEKSQETVGVSPQMFAEFIFPYQLPILERFGLNCYGCCEPLEKRWHVVERIPRLRRVSVPPWSKVPAMAELLGARYVFSLKPNPAELAMTSFDEEVIRCGLRQALHDCRGCRVEVIMKDTHTVRNDPSRLARWVRIAREEAESL